MITTFLQSIWKNSSSNKEHNFSQNSEDKVVLFQNLRKKDLVYISSYMRLPKMNFGGHVVYSRTVTEVEKATAELLKIVETKKKEMGQAILGFDIEWRPTFRKGVSQGKAAVMQICGGNSHCYVMHIIHSGIPRNLQSLLEDPTSIKVGVGIANDAVKVFKDHSVSVKDLEDLSYLANQKLGGDAKKWSLGSLTEMLISKQVNSMYLFGENVIDHSVKLQLLKPNKIRLGNWEADVLSKAQLEYAATDAFASWYLYEVLKSFPDTAENKIEELEGVSICLYNLSEANVCSSGDLKCETSVLLMGCMRVHHTVAFCASFGGSLAASLILVG
ncbi:hypothetical protein AAG906_013073 [Vitis piasezkii]